MMISILLNLYLAIIVSWALLFFGDFFSTFCYHVPEHVFGKLHLQAHHAAKKTFRHYAILVFRPKVLLDGVLGVLPYLVIAALLWLCSPTGVLIGLVLGQLHVWWRHSHVMGWQTPKSIARLCLFFGITTPEQHWSHHQRTHTGYGDIFTILDEPARAWLGLLRLLRLRWCNHHSLTIPKGAHSD
jgi:hypothetical protein